MLIRYSKWPPNPIFHQTLKQDILAIPHRIRRVVIFATEINAIVSCGHNKINLRQVQRF